MHIVSMEIFLGRMRDKTLSSIQMKLVRLRTLISYFKGIDPILKKQEIHSIYEIKISTW